MDQKRMLRIHSLQHWFNLADLAYEEAPYDSIGLRRFASMDPGFEAMPDTTTLLRFRHFLERHRFGEQLFADATGCPRTAA